ncbi:MAG: hypothetical protein U0M22_08895, partial [Acutalibacteraceae bacterium]|nr:hypothetical protein [Acutalibacteraceae bacterium]
MKTKMGKKVLPVLLSLLLVFGIMPATVFAVDFSSGSNSTNAFNWYSKDVSATDLSYEAGDGTIEWKADTKTLTLRNATVTASTVQISFPSNGNGMEINLVLEGDNVFQKSGSATTAIQTGGCKVIVSGNGNLTMENTSSGFTVHPGGELIFSGTGKVKVEGRGTTALDIMNGGKVTVNSGDVEFTTSSGYGKAIRIQSNSALIVEGGSLTARMDKETTYYDSGAICCDDSTGSIAINGGKVTVSSATVGISLKSATTIQGEAQVNVTSGSGAAIGGAAVTITDNADVTAVSGSNTAISGAIEISGNATVLAEGGTTGISGMYGTSLVLEGSPKITAKGGTQAFNLDGMDTKGYTVTVGTEKDGSDAAAWDMETSFIKYGNDYKYAYIESCSHLNATDDDDCTTAVVCPDCGITITEAYEMHNVDSWTSNNDETCTADGTKYGFCTRCGKKVTETDTGSMHAHTMEHYEEVLATCMTQGNVEYWHCSECGKNYANATGGEALDTVTTETNPNNHADIPVWVQTETTHKQVYNCCKVEVSAEAEHEWQDGKCTVCQYPCVHDGGAATCSQLAVCDICGSQYGDYDADNHKAVSAWTQENGKHYHKCEYGCDTHLDEAECSGGTATCTAQALCAVCGGTYGAVDPANHANLVKIEAKAATHLTEGNIEYWHCDGCDKYFKDQAATEEIADLSETVIPKLAEHTPDNTGWHSDDNNHWNTCACGAKLNEAAHTFEWVIDKQPTETEAGSKHEECTVCGYAKAAVEIPATGTT